MSSHRDLSPGATTSRKRRNRSHSNESLLTRRAKTDGGAHGECPLPVTLFKSNLLDMFRKNQVVVCTGETGSGKTTQIPQYLLELELEREAADRGSTVELAKGPLLVAVTQPRRVAAMSVARRVSEEVGCQLGDTVGYTVRFEDLSGPDTRIKYMTDGVLVRECLLDPLLSKYGMVMLDEAHERSIHTDILFGLLKRAVKQRPDLKVVITSATLDVDKFSAYFNNCPTVAVPGRTFPVDIYHSKTKQVMTETGPASRAYITDAVDLVMKIHTTEGPGHVLLFLTGQEEISDACRKLEDAAHKLPPPVKNADAPEDLPDIPHKLVIIPLYGALSGELQSQAFNRAKKGERKVVVATNIAETSVTVPGVRFVVDPGYVKQKAYNPEKRMESLVIVPVSQVAAQQRAGRAGRTAPGQCYRLYSRDCYAAMMRETVPEIMRTNMANTLLYLKVLGVHDVLGFDYLDPPAEDQLLEALQELYCLGALDEDGGVTELGHKMSRFPLDPSLSRALVEGAALGCLEEVLTIVALLSSEAVWHSRKGVGDKTRGDKDKEAEEAHATFWHPLGDPFTYLTVFRAWEQNRFSHEWAKSRFLRVQALRTALKVRTQLAGEVRKAQLGQVSSCGADVDSVRKALCAGFFVNAGHRCAKDALYRSIAMPGREIQETKLMYIHPSSSMIHNPEPPDFVVFVEVVFTGRPYMRHVMAVKQRWLKKHRERVVHTEPTRLSGRPGSASSAGGSGGAATGASSNDTQSAPGAPASNEHQTVTKPRSGADADIEAARARFLARKVAR